MFDLLDHVRREHRVTWMSAPGGAGKTSLATTYLAARKLPVLWYQVDAGDGDVASFFYYLGLAAAHAAPRYKQPLPALTPEYLADLPTFARNFFRAFYSRLRASTVVVLDNYQDAPEHSPLHDVMQIAMAEAPESIHLLVLSRVEPPAVLARLRLCDHAACLDGAKLQLTPEESMGLGAARLGKQVPGAEFLTTLHQRTQGWAAGLVLMLEQARSGAWDANSILPDQQVLFDYFAGEILKRNEPAVRDFLLKTSLLPKISLADARALTGADNADAILLDLTRRTFFTVRLAGPSGDAYEYHPLFREFLRTKLLQAQTIGAPEVAALLRHAASLTEAAGNIEGAVMLWNEAQAWDELTRCLCGSAPTLLKQGRNKLLIAWIEAIPAAQREQRPWLLFWRGQSCLAFSPAEARVHFEQAHAGFMSRQARDGALLAWAGIVDAIIHEYDDTTRLDPWIEWLNKELASTAELPAGAISFRVTSSMAIAQMFRRGRRDEVQPWIDRASVVLEQLPDPSARCRLATYLAMYATCIGDLNRLETLALNIRGWGRQIASASTSGIEAQYHNYVTSLHEWIAGISDYGLRVSIEALAMIEDSGIRILAHHMEARAACGALCNGALPEAKKYLDRLQYMATATQSSRRPYFQYHYLPGWYSLLVGDAAKALREAQQSLQWGRETGLTAFHRGFSTLVAAEALLDLQRRAEAQPYIETVLEIARDFGSPILEFSGLLLRAQNDLASDNASCHAQGLAALRQALALGKRCSYLNTVVWHPVAMAALCQTALEQNIEVEYVQQLVRRRGLLPPPSSVPLENWPWPIRVYTFGRFALVKDGQPVQFEGKAQKKTLELLKALVSLGGREVSEQRLCDSLWPDAEADDARGNLKITLHRLRKLVGHEALILHDTKLHLDVTRCWVDVWTFERLANRLLENGNPLPVAEWQRASDQMFALYRGPFLPADDTLAMLPRERLRGKLLRAIAAVAGQAQRDGAHEQSLAWYERGIEVEPLAEPFYQGLMRVYQTLRRPAEGLSVYQRCKKMLLAEFQVNPAPETEALARALRGMG